MLTNGVTLIFGMNPEDNAVIWWEDRIKLGTEAACKAAGKMATEGKEYVVRDGDVMPFRFNV